MTQNWEFGSSPTWSMILAAAAAAKSLQSCPTLCDPVDCGPPGSPVPGTLLARALEWVPFPSPTHESEKWKWSRSVVSDSVRPCRRQPTRLPRPWDSPGRNTGVGCHFLLQCMTVKSVSEVTQSCPTLSDPMDWSRPGSPVPGTLQAGALERVLPRPWDSPGRSTGAGAIAWFLTQMQKWLNTGSVVSVYCPSRVLDKIFRWYKNSSDIFKESIFQLREFVFLTFFITFSLIVVLLKNASSTILIARRTHF